MRRIVHHRDSHADVCVPSSILVEYASVGIRHTDVDGKVNSLELHLHLKSRSNDDLQRSTLLRSRMAFAQISVPAANGYLYRLDDARIEDGRDSPVCRNGGSCRRGYKRQRRAMLRLWNGGDTTPVRRTRSMRQARSLRLTQSTSRNSFHHVLTIGFIVNGALRISQHSSK